MRSLHSILVDTCQAHNITVAELAGPSRRRKYTMARLQVITEARAAGYAWRDIAEALGRKSHAAALNLLKSAKQAVPSTAAGGENATRL